MLSLLSWANLKHQQHEEEEEEKGERKGESVSCCFSDKLACFLVAYARVLVGRR